MLCHIFHRNRKTLIVVCAICMLLFYNGQMTDKLFQHCTSLKFVYLSVKGLLFRIFNIPTNTKLYISSHDNVFLYSRYKPQYMVNNENLCSKISPHILIFVKVHSEEFERRSSIRRTWGNVTEWRKFGVKSTDVVVLFTLGKSRHHTPEMQTRIEQENFQFHDIIQEEYTENFHNLTLKVLSQLKWPLKFCHTAEFWMTTDSDVFVHIGNLVSFLKMQKPEALYAGHVHLGAIRNDDSASKYFVSSKIYKGVYYPDYCAGGGYVLSMDVVEQLFQKVSTTPLLYIDDVYVGILANLCGIRPTNYAMFFGERRAPTDLCMLSKFITSHGHDALGMLKLFQDIISLSWMDSNLSCWNKYASWVTSFDIVMF